MYIKFCYNSDGKTTLTVNRALSIGTQQNICNLMLMPWFHSEVIRMLNFEISIPCYNWKDFCQDCQTWSRFYRMPIPVPAGNASHRLCSAQKFSFLAET